VLRQPTLLKGRYEVRDLVATGGMATIWRGYDNDLRRDVAIKLMREDLAVDEAAFARFRHEATVLAGIRHPGITVVHDFEGKKAPYFIVMEFLRGRDLAALMRDNSRGLRAERAVRYAAEAAEALAVAHGEGVLHRDIKPGNLFVVKQDNRVKVCDFGIAATIGDSELAASPQWRVGTYAYMAPEQWEGEATASSDLYALGCVLYEMLTGRPPFPPALGEQALRELHLMVLPRAPQSSLDPIPDDLCDVVFRLLAKKPQDRPASASALADELRLCLATPAGRRQPGELRTRIDRLDKLPAASRPPGSRPGGSRPGGSSSAGSSSASATRAPVDAGSPAATAVLPPPARPLPPPSRSPLFPARLRAGAGGELTRRVWAIGAVRVLALALFLTAAVLSVGIGSLHWAPLSRLYLLIPMAIFTLPGALAQYARLTRVRNAVLAIIGLCLAEVGSVVYGLVATRPAVLEACSALAVLAWSAATLSTGSVLPSAD
jgi:eukaryotic-like serine/threonine-protein kinase